MTKYLLALVATASLAACNTSTDGAHGNIAFTPADCGLVGCDLDDSIGVGGSIQINIEGLEGVSTAGTTLVSDNPSVLSVVAVADIGGRPTWEIQALAAGVPTITVYTQGQEVLDFVEIPTQELTGIVATNTIGNAVGPETDVSYDEVWTVNADESIAFQMTPVIGINVPTMGKYVYTATLQPELQAGLIDDDLSDGYLYFKVPAGQYDATFENGWGTKISILIDAKAVQ